MRIVFDDVEERDVFMKFASISTLEDLEAFDALCLYDYEDEDEDFSDIDIFEDLF